MPSEQQKGDLGEAFVTQVLQAQVVKRSQSDEQKPPSYTVSFGDEAHPAWMQIWPSGGTGGGVSIESDWGHLHVEGITRVSTRRGRLWLESAQEGERVVVEVSPTGMWRSGRGVNVKESDLPEEAVLRRGHRESSEVERVVLRGFVGVAPTFRETPVQKQLVASFPLGVHPDQDTTQWLRVVAFGELAKRLQDKPLVVGQEVEVVGFPHERERRTREGDTRHEQQLYAAAIRTSLKETPGSSRS